MIEIFKSDLGQSVKMTELYDYLGLLRANYSRFVKKELFDSFYFEEGKDYSSCMNSNSKIGQRGQFRQEISIHIDAAKKLCMISKSKKGNEIRDELIRLTKQVENASLVSHSQVLEIVKMIKIFSIYEYRQLALSKNKESYVNNALMINPNYTKNASLLYGKFNNWRNEVLNTGKDVLAQRVKEYCLVERKRIPAKFTQDEALTLMGEYEQIKNAIWDLLCSKGKSEEMINNICSLAHELAKEMKPFMQRLNESNLFFNKIDESEVKNLLN
jgi:phage anti-repressor protein